MKNVGFVGYRGMVGSVLLDRMKEENDFDSIKPYFFSTSQKGKDAPILASLQEKKILDAYCLESLCDMDIIISCQGGDYTQKNYFALREKGYEGHFIDASSALRMNDQAMICLDPLNSHHLIKGIESGSKTFAGGNCTVSLMLMALHGLFKEDLIEWVSSMTYQAASGAGSKNMSELLMQMNKIGEFAARLLANPSHSILEVDYKISKLMEEESFPTENFSVPLAGSFIPWIDKKMENGQSKEEWKSMVEANKILKTSKTIPIDGTCVRVGAMRSHGQGLTIKLRKTVDLKTIEDILRNANQWVKVLPNEKLLTTKNLSPNKVSGTLSIPIGRLRKMTLGEDYLNAFTVGDQLLWGAAEPLRRMLKLVIENM